MLSHIFRLNLQINPGAGNLGGTVDFNFLGTRLIAPIRGWLLYPDTKVRH